MKKYIIQYEDYQHIIRIIGRDIPHTNLKGIKMITIDLYEEEAEGLNSIGLKAVPDRKFDFNLCNYTVPNIPIRGFPLPYSPINDFLNITNAHLAGFTGTGVKVAIVDSGATDAAVVTVPTLIRLDFTGTGVTDNLNHGGKLCGIVGQTFSAFAPHDPVTYGMAYGSQVYSVKILDENTTITMVIEGINWCITHDIDVMNCSWQWTTQQDDEIFTATMAAATASGMICIAASGNSSGDELFPPASMPDVIAINCVAYDDANGGAIGSYRNPHLGNNAQVIICNYNFGAAEFLVGGTSQAAAMTTGLMALYKQKYPSLDNEKALNLLRRRARNMDGYIYDIPSTTLNTFVNLVTGGGFINTLN